MCLFFLGGAGEFETQTHVWSVLGVFSHSNHGCSGVCFHLLSASQSQVYCPSHLHPYKHTQLISLLTLPIVSLVSHLLAYLSPQTNLPVSTPPIPQLWFRHHSCSLSLPALDRVTLLLLSHSPSKELYVKHSRAYLPTYCLPLRTSRLARINHRRPWSVESLQLWPRDLGK